jgi:hypothetical protein
VAAAEGTTVVEKIRDSRRPSRWAVQLANSTCSRLQKWEWCGPGIAVCCWRDAGMMAAISCRQWVSTQEGSGRGIWRLVAVTVVAQASEMQDCQSLLPVAGQPAITWASSSTGPSQHGQAGEASSFRL